ncbi:MAG: sugar phosphate isomerase/epimerase [Deltaproteobacteria bacterium]|nr:sugar phosphate isomerase/epimerase [Deltaproteobacteria bacterium]
MKTVQKREPMVHLGGTARSPDHVVQLHELGLQFAEIPITDPKRFSDHVHKYKELLDTSKIYYLCHGPSEGDPNDIRSLENTYLPKLMKVLAIMPELGMRLLTIHLWLDPRFVRTDVIAYKVGLLKRILKTADDAGITICLENLSENATHLSGIFEALPSLGLTLDLGHAQLLTSQNTSFGFMHRFPERIRHMHLHDNKGGNAPTDDLHLPVGKGIIDFERIFKDLCLIGYDRTITLELKPHEIRENLDAVKQHLLDAGFRLQGLAQK